MRIIFALICLTVCSAATPEFPICDKLAPENEEYSKDEGGQCQPTCWDQKVNRTCETTAGFICKTGYIRDPNTYVCIPLAKCPKPLKYGICAKNEEWSKCVSACQLNCYNSSIVKPADCPLKCEPGCACRSSYIRSPFNNQCIHLLLCRACPKNYVRDSTTGKCILQCKICGENEIFSKFGSESACTIPPSQISLIKPGPEDGGFCICQPDFVRNMLTGKCIKQADCPPIKKCGLNEVYNSCGSACESTCAKQAIPIACILICVDGCFCKPGYLKNANNTCVPKEKCTPSCGINEVYQECGTSCPPTCEQPTNQCIAVCKAGCFCKDGFIKDGSGKCIAKATCPPIKQCGEKEEFKKCGSACPPTCESINKITDIGCIEVCTEGCFCKSGFLRDANGKCIPSKLCKYMPSVSVLPVI